MRLVHTADWHVGFRQHERVTRDGVNQREADVLGALRATIDQTIALAPELVVVGGDVFHFAQPNNRAIAGVLAALRRLLDALPHVHVIMVAGNHDSPRSVTPGHPFRALMVLGDRLHLVFGGARVIDLPALDCSVLAVPDEPGIVRPTLVPVGNRRFNVLLMHGETGGILPAANSVHEIPESDLHPECWGYIALGHYHVHRQVGPRAWYSGAIDYTATNPWGELAEQAERRVPGKGIVEHDLATGVHTFHPLPVTRRFVELEPISCPDVDDVDEAIAEAVNGCAGGIDDAVVRLKLYDIHREDLRALNHKALRSYRARALHFQIVPATPELILIGGGVPMAPDAEREILTPRVVAPVAPLAGVDRLAAMPGPYDNDFDEAAFMAALPGDLFASFESVLAEPETPMLRSA